MRDHIRAPSAHAVEVLDRPNMISHAWSTPAMMGGSSGGKGNGGQVTGMLRAVVSTQNDALILDWVWSCWRESPSELRFLVHTVYPSGPHAVDLLGPPRLDGRSC